ncbi:hypothetical protein L202_03539 [Cryptococcus amylolentus CBS 6039]|uniref:Uncharacterized protein n=1 Tax=Cryptococcus amylolentus CBS 6039 TaxID=1295533 RepID=A0A1E3HTF8_9TREE|nr:hypothetical protein L202_03539 [Cryptococcus amylolentus CBS 6039]ODN79592.1 hypothetical protein L202_03539 [Cryptococcus amylolentus CBS 6039]
MPDSPSGFHGDDGSLPPSYQAANPERELLPHILSTNPFFLYYPNAYHFALEKCVQSEKPLQKVQRKPLSFEPYTLRNGLKSHYFTEFAHEHIKISRQEACKAWLACMDMVHILEWLSKAPPKLVAQKARAIDTEVPSWGTFFNAPTNDFSKKWWRLLFQEWRNCTEGARELSKVLHALYSWEEKGYMPATWEQHAPNLNLFTSSDRTSTAHFFSLLANGFETTQALRQAGHPTSESHIGYGWILLVKHVTRDSPLFAEWHQLFEDCTKELNGHEAKHDLPSNQLELVYVD